MINANPPLTSIVMVSYRTGDVLFQAMASVLAQTEPVELCLIDNGNPSEVMTRIQSMASADPRIHFITGHGNVGFSRGCNIGARMTKGEHILFLNPDSILSPDAIAKLKYHGAGLGRPWMLGARLLDEHGKDQRGCRRALLTPKTAFIEALHLGKLFPKVRLNFNKEPIPERLASMPAISGAFMFLPRADFWAVGGFDEDYFLHVEDLDLCLRFRSKGGEIYFAPDIAVKHIGGTSKVAKGFIEKHKTNGFIRYFHKNFGDQYPAPFLWLLYAATYLRMWVKLSMAVVR